MIIFTRALILSFVRVCGAPIGGELMIDQDQPMVPPTRYRRRALAVAAPLIHPTDRLSQLPDEVLAQILSFLPAQEAVQTCILARTWRNVWKMTKGLLITAVDYVEDVQAFVGGLLRVRLDGLECAPLHSCEIMVDPFEDANSQMVRFNDEDMDSVNTWIRLVLECEVQTLRVNILARMDLDAYFLLDPLSSRHLSRLVLIGVHLCSDLDLSGCPALEYLKISESWLGLDKMVSPSLKRLVITSSCETTQEMLYTIQICVPRLVSLRLEASDWTPLLESMPDLVWAHVEFSSHILNSNFDSEAAQNATKCFVLEGLAEAEDLMMVAYQKSTEIFTSDLRWCPTFSKLKTLVLNDKLYEPTDCTLMCILQHAPVLEKFTFIFCDDQWRGNKFKVEVNGCLDETSKSTMISQHIKKVKVRCNMVDERVLTILNFFGKLNICFQIRVTE